MNARPAEFNSIKVRKKAETVRAKKSIGFELDMVREAGAIIALAGEWRTLELLCPNTVLFQSHDWCSYHMEFMRENASFRPIVVTIRQGNRLVGLLPLCLQQKAGYVVLTGFCEPFQQYTEILLDPSTDFDQIRPMLARELRKIGADYCHFGQVRADGQLAQILEGIAKPSGESDAAPYVDLRDFPDHATYLQSVNSKTRKNLRNLKNRLERDAPVTHHVFRKGGDLKEAIARAYEGREAWLARLGITSRAFRDVNFEAFLTGFGIKARNEVETVSMSLRHGDTPLSDQFGFVYRGRYYAYMATWNTKYEAVSPGRLHLGEVVAACFDEGFEIADFMIPASSYKLTWTDNSTPVRDYVLPLGFRGRLYVSIWLGITRPMAKKLFFILPTWLRSMLVKRVLPSVE